MAEMESCKHSQRCDWSVRLVTFQVKSNQIPSPFQVGTFAVDSISFLVLVKVLVVGEDGTHFSYSKYSINKIVNTILGI